jgi:hypothetical protein
LLLLLLLLSFAHQHLCTPGWCCPRCRHVALLQALAVAMSATGCLQAHSACPLQLLLLPPWRWQLLLLLLLALLLLKLLLLPRLL